MRVIAQDVALKMCEGNPHKLAFIHSMPTINAVPGMNGVWISFSERAPEIGERILWWAVDDRIYDVVYRGIKDYGNGNRKHVVEKNRRLRIAGVWMPRPKSPLEMLKE